MDKFESYIKSRFDSFAPNPPDKIWKTIHRHITPWYKALIFKVSAVAAIISAITIAIIILSNSPSVHKTYPAQEISDSQYQNTSITIRQPSTQRSNSTESIPYKTISVSIKPKSQPPRATKHNKLIKTQTKQNQNAQVKGKKISFTSSTNQSKINFDISITPHRGCEPLKVNFAVRAPRQMNISWFIDKQIVSQEPKFQHILGKGTHFVQLAIFDSMQTILVYDTIIVYPRPSAEFETFRCKAGDTIRLKNLSINAQTYTWQFNNGEKDTCTNPKHIFLTQGLYNVTLIAYNKYCSDTVAHVIAIEPRDKAIIFPNAFVPDLSGPNGGYYNPNERTVNIFHPVLRKPIKTYDLKIFDRTGRLLFESHDVNQGWDGYYHDKVVPIGVYIFVAQGRFEDGQSFTDKGDITVIYKR